ncbi:MAG: SRPBCC family protein [Dehalococcoidia bacterium]
MPSVTASLVIPAPPEEVWKVISDVANARRWNTTWTRIEITSEQTHGRGTRFRAFTAESGEFDFEITEWVTPEYIAFAPIRDPEEPRYEVTLDWHAFKLIPVDGGSTRVDLTARATARGIRGRIVGMFFWPGHQQSGLEDALKSVASMFGVEAEEVS